MSMGINLGIVPITHGDLTCLALELAFMSERETSDSPIDPRVPVVLASTTQEWSIELYSVIYLFSTE